MINEEWRPINGFDYYEVSNYGKVRSIDHTVFAGNRVRFVKGRERINTYRGYNWRFSNGTQF